MACGETKPEPVELKVDFAYNGKSSVPASHEPHSIRGVGAGVALADVNADGRVDMFIATNSESLGEGLYFGGSDGAFTRSTQSFAVDNLLANGAAFADLDNDGDQDLVVIGVGMSQLFENRGAGKFRNITATALPAAEDTSTTVAVGDYDNDGLLDLYICNLFGSSGMTVVPNHLLRNRGNLTFEEVTQAMALSVKDASWGASWFDYDGDGDQDLYVLNDTFTSPDRPTGIANALPDNFYENRGAEGFVDVASSMGVDGRRASMGIAVGDVTGDHRLDLWVTDIGKDHLFAGNGQSFDETVIDVPNVNGSTQIGWGVAFTDVDRDGDLDLMVAHGEILTVGQLGTDQPNTLSLNRGNGTFSKPIVLEQGAQTQQGRCIAVGDLDGDSDDDFVVAPYNDDFLFIENRVTTPGSFLRVKLLGNGTTCNRDAIGARLRLKLEDGSQQWRWLAPASTPGCFNDKVLEFGLGDSSPGALTVFWPDGSERTYTSFSPNRVFTVSQSGRVTAGLQ